MDELETAGLMLAGATLAFLAILVFAIWRVRRPSTTPAAPRQPRTPGESRMPKLPRRAKPVLDPVQMAPSRLARISRKAPLDQLSDERAYDHRPAPIADIEPAVDVMLESLVAEVEEKAHQTEGRGSEEPGAEAPGGEEVTLLLTPQIPPRDAISTNSWLGGCPRLPAGMEWPQIDGEPADFLAQIDCAGLPPDLWGGLGPRDGALAVFIHRRRYDVRVFHLHDNGAPVSSPLAPGDRGGWFGPHGGLDTGDLAAFAIRAFPPWPVDLVALRPGDADPRREGDPGEPVGALYNRGYDIADPAFHPFDWGSMTAMVALLEMRLDRLAAEAAPPAGAVAEPVSEMEARAAINREARDRAGEIIAIVHDSAARTPFSASDATAVMAALHAIRWTKALRTTNPETGAEQVETITLPLTTHHPDADLWVHDYQMILFDRAKHAWCANPDSLSAPARAFYEPLWRELGARTMAMMGDEPSRHIPDYDDKHEAVLLELPTSGLMSRVFGDRDNLVVTIDRTDLAVGDFSKLRAQVSS